VGGEIRAGGRCAGGTKHAGVSVHVFVCQRDFLYVKAHTDRARFGNATRIFSFQKQIKPSTDKNFTRYAGQIAKIA
jgi:hypothetical protein